MDSENTLRSYTLGVRLRGDEYKRLEADAKRYGVTHAEALRRACPEFFAETGVKQGRRAGISPWKLER